MYRRSMDIINIIWQQLPRGIADKVKLDVETDAYFIRPVAVVTLPNGQVHKCPLEPREFEGMSINMKVPEAFIAQLCVMV